MHLARATAHAGPVGNERTTSPATPRHWPREAAWFVLPLALCPLVALLRPGTPDTALGRGAWLLAAQRDLGLAIEPAIHRWVATRPLVAGVISVHYLVVHIAALIGAACWLYARRPAGYRELRARFAFAQTVTALLYVAMPVAPLRMVLTGDSTSPAGAWSRSVQYEFAAMPSGHVVFALVIGISVWQHAGPRWRWLGVAHPVCTVLVVMATAHHLLADALGAALVVAVVTTVVRRIDGHTVVRVAR